MSVPEKLPYHLELIKDVTDLDLVLEMLEAMPELEDCISKAEEKKLQRAVGLENYELDDKDRLKYVFHIVKYPLDSFPAKIAISKLHPKAPTQAQKQREPHRYAKKTFTREKIAQRIKDFYAQYPRRTLLPRRKPGSQPTKFSIARKNDRHLESSFNISDRKTILHQLKQDSSPASLKGLVQEAFKAVSRYNFQPSPYYNNLYDKIRASVVRAMKTLDGKERNLLMVAIDPQATPEAQLNAGKIIFSGRKLFAEIDRSGPGQPEESIEELLVKLAFCFAYRPLDYLNLGIVGRPKDVQMRPEVEHLYRAIQTLTPHELMPEAMKQPAYQLANFEASSREKLAVQDTASWTSSEYAILRIAKQVGKKVVINNHLYAGNFTVEQVETALEFGRGVQALHATYGQRLQLAEQEIRQRLQESKAKQLPPPTTQDTATSKTTTHAEVPILDNSTDNSSQDAPALSPEEEAVVSRQAHCLAWRESLSPKRFKQEREGIAFDYTLSYADKPFLIIDACKREVNLENFHHAKLSSVTYKRGGPNPVANTVKAVAIIQLGATLPLSLSFYSPDVSDHKTLMDTYRQINQAKYSMPLIIYDRGYNNKRNKALAYHCGISFVECFKRNSNSYLQQCVDEAIPRFNNKADTRVLRSGDLKRKFIVEEIDLATPELGMSNSEGFYQEAVDTETNKFLNENFAGFEGLVDEEQGGVLRKLITSPNTTKGQWVREYNVRPKENHLYLVHVKDEASIAQFRHQRDKFLKKLHQLNLISLLEKTKQGINDELKALKQKLITSLEKANCDLKKDVNGRYTVNPFKLEAFLSNFGVRTFVTNLHMDGFSLDNPHQALAFAELVADLYEARWKIETLFYETKTGINGKMTHSKAEHTFILKSILHLLGGSLKRSVQQQINNNICIQERTNGRGVQVGSNCYINNWAGFNKTYSKVLSAVANKDGFILSTTHTTSYQQLGYSLSTNNTIASILELNAMREGARTPLGGFYNEFLS